VLADAVAVGADGKATIIGAGVGRVNATTLPWSLAQLCVYLTLEGEGDDDAPGTHHDLYVRVLAPDDVLVAQIGGPFDAPSGAPDGMGMVLLNAVPVFQQLQFAAAGRHMVHVIVDDHPVGSYPLDVVLVPGGMQTTWSPIPVPEPQQTTA
jgi:hypothetical protein